MRDTTYRRQKIVVLTQELGKVRVDDLAEKFGVSAVTIRSDLTDLDSKGFLVRSHGGAIANSKMVREISVKEKYLEHARIKRRLGKKAAELINDGDSVILDSGTTTEEVARFLGKHKDLLLMTNGLNVASVLVPYDSFDILVTGGKLRKKSMSFYGEHAQKSLKYIHFDKVVLGVDGVDIGAGISTYFEHEAALNRTMCEVSREVIVVTDSSKFDQRGFYKIIGLDKVTTLVTDYGIPQKYVEALKDAGVNVIIVER